MTQFDIIKEKITNFTQNNNIDAKKILHCFSSDDLDEIISKLEALDECFLKNYALELVYEQFLITSSYKIERTGMTLGLHRMEEILAFFNNPEKDLKVIHVAGTNGKGSVSNYLKDALKTKYNVGFYTSPGLVSFNDRIRINDNFISYKTLYNLFKKVTYSWYKILKKEEVLSFFEILTTCAILYFKEIKTDFVIMEVGLGGRYDATNIFDKKILSIITKISLDHTSILGETLEKIAFEKAGIIKKNDVVITYPQEKNAENVLLDVAQKQNAKIITFNIKDVIIKETTAKKNIFTYKNFENIELKMVGRHQIYNATLALLALDYLQKNNIITLTTSDVKKSFLISSWAGRLEWLFDNILLDGAHNKDGMQSLVTYIKNANLKNLKILVGILEDKDYKEMITMLETLPAEFFITRVPIDIKKSSTENIKNTFSKNTPTVFENIQNALDNILPTLKQDETLLISGSLYLVAEARRYLLDSKKIQT